MTTCFHLLRSPKGGRVSTPPAGPRGVLVFRQFTATGNTLGEGCVLVYASPGRVNCRFAEPSPHPLSANPKPSP